MVLSLFRKGPTGLEHVSARAVGMLGDARHSFDLATVALLTGGEPDAVAADIRATDERINVTEQELRSELIVHVAVQGRPDDIGSVLSMILLLKKIERLGDQAKNMLDLAEMGVSLESAADHEAMLAERAVISAMFNEAADLLSEPDETRLGDFSERGLQLMDAHNARIERYVHSERPGVEVVPLAIYYRYLKRIVANLLGVARMASEPVTTPDDPEIDAEV
jgi:hypothetical protein